VRAYDPTTRSPSRPLNLPTCQPEPPSRARSG
jgi:hypothetical protein